MDFSKYKLSGINYGGSEKKIGIYVNGNKYMLKFQKNTVFGKRNNHLSECIGSRIFELIGIPVQKVYLGTYKGENVVACKDFINDLEQFVPFNDVGESTIDIDISKYQYTYENIMFMLEENKKITNVEETISMFWNMYIVDAFIDNFDRHGNNWGFIKNNNKYKLAPIFDNGSCLYPQMIDEHQMELIIDSDEETDKRIYSYPTSQIKIDDKKSSYYDVIYSTRFDECNKALIRIYNKIDIKRINDIIDNIENISEIHRKFYKHMIRERYEKTIKKTYIKLMGVEE